MTDQELIAWMRNRAKEDHQIQANNEAVATALQGQRLLFDQGFRSQSNTFAVRLGLDYENCAKKDAELVAIWEAAADRIEELVKEVERRIEPEQVENLVKMADPIMSELYAVEYSCRQEAEAKLTKAVEALREILMKPRDADKFYVELWADTIKEVRAVLAELEGKE